MKHVLVAVTAAAFLFPVAWAAPAQAVDPGCDQACMHYCGSFVNDFKAKGYTTLEDAVEACYTAVSATGAPVTAAADVAVSPPPDTGNGSAQAEIAITSHIEPNIRQRVCRAKTIDGLTISHPKRVTAMAKRFIAAPGDVINIHGYGPDQDTALTKAHHVRETLQAEITRLGGNAGDYPVFVTYAGDPDHKNGVDVTIHQHARINNA